MTTARAFIGLGSNAADRDQQTGRALAALDRDGVRVAGAGGLVLGPYEPLTPGAGDVLNTVAEVRTTLAPPALLERLQAIERDAGRTRDEPHQRALDLDLLAYEDRVIDEPGLRVPHPRCTQRRFVLDPWSDVAPTFVVPASEATGRAATVVEHAASQGGPALTRHALPDFAERGKGIRILRTRDDLGHWRATQEGTVGVLMTMGALHAGHAANMQRAAAECDVALATLFVNPLQFGADEDLDRYPRTFDDDCALLLEHGATAVYAPEPSDLYPEGFATYVDPGGAAQGYEGAERPDHFRGVATVVLKLWQRTRPDRVYFGRKDAQQVAVVTQMARDLDLEGDIVVCPTIREPDGLALSSRNRYFDNGERARARALSAALAVMGAHAADGVTTAATLEAAARAHLTGSVDAIDYVAVVDADTMTPVAELTGPALAVAAARIGSVRLLDNLWIAPPVRSAVEA